VVISVGCVTRKPTCATKAAKARSTKQQTCQRALLHFPAPLHRIIQFASKIVAVPVLVHRRLATGIKVIRLDYFALAFIRRHEPPAAKSAALSNSSSLLSIAFTITTYLSQQPVFPRTSHSKLQTQQNRFLSLPAICGPSSRTSTPSKSARRKLSASARNTPTAFL
jgi:hypothetical protein